MLLRRYTKRYVAIRQSSRLRSIHLISCRRMAGQRVFMQIYPVPYYERIYLLSQTWRFDMPASISHVISGHDKIVTVCVMFIIRCCCCCCYMQFLSPLPNPAQSPPPPPPHPPPNFNEIKSWATKFVLGYRQSNIYNVEAHLGEFSIGRQSFNLIKTCTHVCKHVNRKQ